jgi:hypothetical protein
MYEANTNLTIVTPWSSRERDGELNRGGGSSQGELQRLDFPEVRRAGES